MSLKDFFRLFVWAILPVCMAGCSDEEHAGNEDENAVVIWGDYVSVENPTIIVEGMTKENFPIIDGSDSTEPLRDIITCNLLGLNYQWIKSQDTIWGWGVLWDYENEMSYDDFLNLARKMLRSNTHQAFVNLIDHTVELIITAREISRDEAVYAQERGVTLLQTPIAKDAFIFMVHPENPINSLTIAQIQGIYTGKIRNWSEVGGNEATISPYIRNANSGSQEKMETMVMEGLEMIDWPEMVGGGMISPYYMIENDKNGIAYTPFYYFDTIIDDDGTKSIGVNGIAPSKETIIDGTYPYITEVYVAVRSDIDRNSMAYKLYEALVNSGSAVVEESGYVPMDR